jgi:translation elongation factor P/translation initiation factor 5A
MIIDAKKYMNTYKCSSQVAKYLILERNMPVLGVDKKYYYFADTELLREVLGSLPPLLKVIDRLTPR